MFLIGQAIRTWAGVKEENKTLQEFVKVMSFSRHIRKYYTSAKNHFILALLVKTERYLVSFVLNIP